MYWADELIQNLDKSKKHRVDDMKTPSGHAHVGSLRAIATHALVYEAMKHAGYDVDFTYVVNDMDPMDSLPHYLDKNIYEPHMGKPLFQIPAPDGKSVNYADQYAEEYIGAFNKLGIEPQIIWSSKLYARGLMNEYIRIALDHVVTVRKIYLSVAKQKKPENWYPVQVICPQCGKVGSTIVTGWDGERVTFSCKPDLVEWAKGCGYEGTTSPFDGRAKLMWKVDWPAHWKALHITVEGAGKDHLSAGGSHDIGVEISRKVFTTEPPFAFLHEFFLVGGAKMSSSKGVGIRAIDIVDIIPPELVRFIFVRTPYKQAINLDPSIPETIPDLFDDYDECAASWFKNGDKTKEGRMFQAAQLKRPSKDVVFLPRFRNITKLVQMPSVDLETHFAEEKGSALTSQEKNILRERIDYAKLWLKHYAPAEEVFTIAQSIPEMARTLSEQQKKYIYDLSALLHSSQFNDAEKLQFALYELAKKHAIKSVDSFKAIYQVFLGKNYGPKAGWLLFDLLKKDKEFVMKRLNEIQNSQQNKATEESINYRYEIKKQNLVSINEAVKSCWNSIVVGYAIIKNVKIQPEDVNLETEKTKVLEEFSNLTVEDINTFKEIQSYRKLYKETGIDWHSRRPSPEALLRRIAQKKPLYKVNTCVDAYNLVVIKNHVSVGAFDYKKVAFPTLLQIAEGDEHIVLLGDTDPTTLKTGEICYFDQNGPYNLDFNYRDADRTKVTLDTTDLWINVEGIHDISRHDVEKTLFETIEIIQKFCGGEVAEAGMLA